MSSFRPYKSYRFIDDKDPAIYRLKTIIADAGVTHQQLHEESGVSTSCMRNWFSGPTRRPSHAALAAVASVLGYDFVLQKRARGAKVIDFKRRKRA